MTLTGEKCKSSRGGSRCLKDHDNREIRHIFRYTKEEMKVKFTKDNSFQFHQQAPDLGSCNSKLPDSCLNYLFILTTKKKKIPKDNASAKTNHGWSIHPLLAVAVRSWDLWLDGNLGIKS